MTTTREINSAALRDLLAAPGPVASVYLRLEPRPQPEDDAELRWHSLAKRLTADGADAATVAALGKEVDSALPGTGVLAAFAAGGELRLSARIPGSAQGDLAAWSPLPHVLPLLEWRQDHPAHVVAVIDRTGADLAAYPAGGTEAVTARVEGTDDEIERNAPGGMAQARYQRRAEDSWEHNAVRVGEAVTELLSRVSARLLLVSGDVRARQYLVKHLPPGVRKQLTIREVSGGRAADGSGPVRAAQVDSEAHHAGEDETRELLRMLSEERHAAGRAVEGARETLQALAGGRVGTLVLAHDPQDGRSAWFGPAPTAVGDRPERVYAADGPVQKAPLGDAAVRTAVLTGADVRVVPPDQPELPAHGIGALCRYA